MKTEIKDILEAKKENIIKSLPDGERKTMILAAIDKKLAETTVKK